MRKHNAFEDWWGAQHIKAGDAPVYAAAKGIAQEAWAAAERGRYQLRPLDEWCEEDGNVLWWIVPICEPPYCGTPLDGEWPDYHTHWCVLPEPDDECDRADSGAQTDGGQPPSPDR